MKHLSFNRVKHGQRIVAHVNVLISNHFPVHLDLFGQILPVAVFQKSQYLIPSLRMKGRVTNGCRFIVAFQHNYCLGYQEVKQYLKHFYLGKS